MDYEKDEQIKKYYVVIIGPSQVGKTHLVQRYIYQRFPKYSNPTIGIEFHKQNVDGETSEILFWDTPGQSRYRSIAQNIYEKSQGAIIVFDITKKQTFQEIPEFINEIRKHAGPDIPILLVGNKLDKVKDNNELRQVTTEEAKIFADQYKVLYEEVSADLNNNVQESIKQLISQVLKVSSNTNKVQQKE